MAKNCIAMQRVDIIPQTIKRFIVKIGWKLGGPEQQVGFCFQNAVCSSWFKKKYLADLQYDRKKFIT